MTKLILFLVLLTIYRSVNSQFTTCSSKEACIPYRECDAVKNIIAKGRLSAEDRQYLKKIQCKAENHMAYVCCAKEVNIEDLLPKAPKCGMQFTDRIVGGVTTNINEFPWTVQIQYLQRNGELDSHCGGALINERYVLTAAHCRNLPKGFSLAQVRLGDWNVTTNPDCDDNGKCNDPYVEIPIEKVIIHENYNPQNTAQGNDIALIKLERDVVFTEFIKPICLAIDPSVRSINLTNHDVEVVGFGKTENRSSSDQKLKVGVTINSQDSCKDLYKKSVTITNKQLCAGGEVGKDSCNGDSGGPLMKEISNPGSLPYYLLIGIVSFGPKDCGTKDMPGVYTRVSEYIDWIADNMD